MLRFGNQLTVTSPLIATCLVFERDGRWTAAVRRLSVAGRLRVRRVVSWRMCEERLAEFPDCVVFVELRPAAATEHVRRLAEGIDRHRRAMWVVVGTAELDAWQWPLREFGVVDVVLAPTHLNRTASIVQRHGRRVAPPSSSLEQRVARLLPWPEWAEKFRIVNPAERTVEAGSA